MTTIGERIHSRRHTLGWTLDRLAKEAEVSKGFLSDMENGKRKTAGGDYLMRIAGALGVSLDHLITGSPISDTDEAVHVPAPLANLARKENLSFPETLLILNLRKQVHAFRNETGADDFDWKSFYDAVKPHLR